MSNRRRMMVWQRERLIPANEANGTAAHWVFWFVVRTGTVTSLTSETYYSRSNAVRAARRFIAAVAPVPVRFVWRRYRTTAMEDFR